MWWSQGINSLVRRDQMTQNRQGIFRFPFVCLCLWWWCRYQIFRLPERKGLMTVRLFPSRLPMKIRDLGTNVCYPFLWSSSRIHEIVNLLELNLSDYCSQVTITKIRTFHYRVNCGGFRSKNPLLWSE